LEAYFQRKEYDVHDVNELLGTSFHPYDVDEAWAQLRRAVERGQIDFPDRNAYVWFRQEEEAWKRTILGHEYVFTTSVTDDEWDFHDADEELPDPEKVERHNQALGEMRQYIMGRESYIRDSRDDLDSEDGDEEWTLR
jgi:hypothetical protein